MNTFWSVTLFWFAAAACVVIALAFVLPPLLRRRGGAAKAARRDINIAVYRDQMKELEAEQAGGLLSPEQFQAARMDLEARLAEDALVQADAELRQVASRRLGFSLAGILPVAAFGLYFWLGNPDSLIAIADAQADAGQAAQAQGGHDIMQMIRQVEARVQADANDGQAWTMLAKTYAVVDRWPEALHAYEQAMRLRPDVAEVMTGYAEALAINGDRTLQGKPMELVRKALEIDPNDTKGLQLAGIDAFQGRNFAQAAYYFKQLLKLLPPESPYAKDVTAAFQEAKRLAEGGLTGLDNLADQGAADQPAAGATIQGKLDIAAPLKGRVTDRDVVFLFARAAPGGPPVAAIRGDAGQFPLAFELSDAMAMNPENKLSNHREVTLIARIAKSGDIKGAAGDLEGTLTGVKVGSQDVRLVIDTVRQ